MSVYLYSFTIQISGNICGAVQRISFFLKTFSAPAWSLLKWATI